MLSSFWSGLGGELAKQWIARVLTPAFAFWAAGLSAVWVRTHRSDVEKHGWSETLAATAKPLESVPALSQGALLLIVLILLAASALIAERLTLPLLRLLEGYWSRPRWLWQALVNMRGSQREGWVQRIAPLQTRQRRGDLTVAEYAELLRLESATTADPERVKDLRQRRAQCLKAKDTATLARGLRILRRTPELHELLMPTRLGNILRAAERRPIDKYGLDTVVTWTAFWLLLPDQTKSELVQSRTALDNATRVWLWGALFIVWTPWTIWAIPIAILVPTLSYYVGMLGAAALFGDLVVAAFDLHRMSLYDSLHLARPKNPIEERDVFGLRVNNALWGGLDEPGLRYSASPPPN